MLGHYHLWLGGVEHNDISVNNLMYDKLHDRGVLNDYDLAHLVGHPRPGGKEHTGTIPFMAMDLSRKLLGRATLPGNTVTIANRSHGFSYGYVAVIMKAKRSRNRP